VLTDLKNYELLELPSVGVMTSSGRGNLSRPGKGDGNHPGFKRSVGWGQDATRGDNRESSEKDRPLSRKTGKRHGFETLSEREEIFVQGGDFLGSEAGEGVPLDGPLLLLKKSLKGFAVNGAISSALTVKKECTLQRGFT